MIFSAFKHEALLRNVLEKCRRRKIELVLILWELLGCYCCAQCPSQT